MTAEEFIDILEQRALLPASAIGSLRQFVAKSLKIVTPESLAGLLVEKGRLTSEQAEQLLKPASAAPAAADDEFSLAPLDDPPRRSAEPTSAKTAPPAVAKTKAVAQDRPPATPAPASAAASKGAAAPSKVAAGAKPIATAAKSAQSKPRPALQPLGDVDLPPLSTEDAFGLPLSSAGPLDDLLGEPSLMEMPAALLSGHAVPAARRRSGVPMIVWIGSAGAAWLLLVVVGRSSRWAAATAMPSGGLRRKTIRPDPIKRRSSSSMRFSIAFRIIRAGGRPPFIAAWRNCGRPRPIRPIGSSRSPWPATCCRRSSASRLLRRRGGR